jgi:heptose-I-phosphate ethanolaminephosphotransferase
MRNIDWRGLGIAYLFFWFFSGLCHALLLGTGATGFTPLRQGAIFSALWLIPLVVFPRQARPIAAVIGFLLWGISLVNLGYFIIYGGEFSQSVLFIVFESNPAEASEYLGNYFVWWLVPAVFGYSASAYGLWTRVRPLDMPTQARALTLILLAALLVLPPLSKVVRKREVNGETLAESYANRMEPAVPWKFVTSFVRYREQLAEVNTLLEHTKSIPPVAKLVDSHSGKPRTLVLVLGESTNRQHMSLYGYTRSTTPKLDARRDQLAVFNQVFAPRPYTIEVLQQVLTFADQENPELYRTTPSLISIMKQAGYKTYWITNQQTLTKRNTLLTSFSEQADEQVYLNHSQSQNSYQFDGDVLEPFGRFLNDDAPRRFIVIHLLGTHMRYKYRYPPRFDEFKNKEGLPGWVTDKHLPMINEYDNAVRYNDEVVSGIIDTLDAAGSTSLLTYFSDHGEDVYDSPEHDFIGRNESRPTAPMYTVPFFLWSSAQWQQMETRKFVGPNNPARNRVYQTSHFLHTWADLAGLRFEGFDPSKSLINPAFKERPILVGDPANPAGLFDLRTGLGTPTAAKVN